MSKSVTRDQNGGLSSALLKDTQIRYKEYMCIVIFAMAFHFIAYTNYYLGHDAAKFYSRNDSWDIVTGRYVGIGVKALHNFLQTPYLIGVISSCFMAITILCLVKIFRIRTPLGTAALAVCSVAWPSYIMQHIYIC